MKLMNSYYDPNDRPQPILLGVFPAHVISFTEGNNFNGSIPFNFIMRIAEEASKFKGYNWRDGKEESAENMVGREVRSVGLFFNPTPEKGQSWRNNKYVESCEALGVEFPKDKKTNVKQLGKIEPFDVLHKPCMVEIRLETDKRDKGQENPRRYPKVFSILPWEDGEELDISQEIDDNILLGEDGETEEEVDEKEKAGREAFQKKEG